MTTIRPEITGRATNTNPLAVTVQQACELSGLGATSIWAALKDERTGPRGRTPERLVRPYLAV